MKTLVGDNFDKLLDFLREVQVRKCQHLIHLVIISTLNSQSHKSAWPFIDPVDASEVPDYYNVIKEPMGKLKH